MAFESIYPDQPKEGLFVKEALYGCSVSKRLFGCLAWSRGFDGLRGGLQLSDDSNEL